MPFQTLVGHHRVLAPAAEREQLAVCLLPPSSA
jgi:hypothetical protein